jgi:hypothetical protein
MTKLLPTSGHQSMTAPFPKTRRVTEASEPRSIKRTSGSAPLPNTSSHLNWAMLAIWGCVVLSFAAFFFAGYIIWVKCHSDWPY